MTICRKTFNAALLSPLLMATLPNAALACASCYGEPDSPMSKGLTWAILVLVLVVAAVLAGVVAFFVHTVKNSAAMEEAAASAHPPTGKI